jgi:hypothetical protein
MLGDLDAVMSLVEKLKSDALYKADRDYFKIQFCDSLHDLNVAGDSAPAGTMKLAKGFFCR